MYEETYETILFLLGQEVAFCRCIQTRCQARLVQSSLPISMTAQEDVGIGMIR